MEQTQPLVSCILPTYNRRHLIGAAIRQFLRQTYSNKELIIVDDGEDCIEDIVKTVNHPSISYIRWNDHITIGRKRNIACENAKGEYIAHFDDDDWYSPHRLAEQVQLMKQSGCLLTGYNSVMMYHQKSDRAIHYYEDPTSIVGATFMYRKDYWKTHRFPDVSIGEDTYFMRRVPQDYLIGSPGLNRFIIVDGHGSNVSDRTFDAWLARYPEVQIEEVHKLITFKTRPIMIFINSKNNKDVPDKLLNSAKSEQAIMKTLGYDAELVVSTKCKHKLNSQLFKFEPTDTISHFDLVSKVLECN